MRPSLILKQKLEATTRNPVILSWDLTQQLLQEFKDFQEQVSALESKEVCNAPHDDDVIEGCPYCRIELFTVEIGQLRSGLKLIEATGCERLTSPEFGCATTSPNGWSKDALYSDERWCDPCIAHDALHPQTTKD